MKLRNLDPSPNPTQSRRGFLRHVTQSGLLAGAAAVGVGVGGARSESAQPNSDFVKADKLSYHETEHTREYYRSARIF